MPAEDALRGCLTRQHDTAWKLTCHHLDGLTTEECLWRPAPRGLHVYRSAAGGWRADWPDHEGYELGPPSIAWVTWHMGFWWSMVLDHCFGAATLRREDVHWPGTADAVRARLNELHGQWQGVLTRCTDADFQSTRHSRWPYRNRPFSDVAAWLNVELSKNAAEIGYARFLYAIRR